MSSDKTSDPPTPPMPPSAPSAPLPVAPKAKGKLATILRKLRIRGPRPSPDSSKSDVDRKAGSTEKATDKKEERFEVKREAYDPVTMKWLPVEEDVSEGGADGKLFTVRHRAWPKMDDFKGREDTTTLEVHSKSLIPILRLKLRQVEEAFDDKPAIDSKELFLHLAELDAFVAENKSQIRTLESKSQLKSAEEKTAGKMGKTPASAAPATSQTSTQAKVPAAVTDDKVAASVEKKDDEDDETLGVGVVPVVPKTLEQLKTEVDHMEVLVEYVNTLFAPVKAKLERLLADASISYALLWTIFRQDTYIESTDETCGECFAFRLSACSYEVGRDGPYFSISGRQLFWTGSRYSRSWFSTQISKFKGVRKISSLSAQPLLEKHRAELTARGRLYVGLSRVAFLSYSGLLITSIGTGFEKRIIKLRAEGRAVVDVKGYRRMNASRDPWGGVDDDDEDSFDFHRQADEKAAPRYTDADGVPEKELCLLPPCVYGFSLVQREWGEFRVDQFSEIIFNDKAYDSLVMDLDQKDLIRSLVEQNSKASVIRALESEAGQQQVAKADFVAGKGGGLVVALHGRPGTGKTLTAEAIAEVLKVPLYAVGAGELGVQADVLEKRLRDVLEIGASWGAVLLVDEADVFLEQRSLHDITRNAMVSVFLRLLEYHSGILILTTNRIRTIDPAFLSRFSLAITYADLSPAKRRMVWTTFLERAGARIEEIPKKTPTNGVIIPPRHGASEVEEAFVAVVDTRPLIRAQYLDRLAKKEFNGRSIKNSVRTAHALAQSKGVALAEEHLDVVVKASEVFMSDLKEPDEDGVYDADGEGWKSRTNVYS